MAESVLVDAGFLVALLSRRDTHHRWSVVQGERFPPPWSTCEAALSEAFHLVGPRGVPALATLLRRGAVAVDFDLGPNLDAVLKLMQKFADLPASLADACLVRMSEMFPHPVVITTDADFRIYRRHGRRVIPCVTPN
jgi:predicted nucleic acid-binding protein